VFERLQASRLVLCIADIERMMTPMEMTADYAYCRLRDEGCPPDDIARLVDTIATPSAKSFRVEDTPLTPPPGSMVVPVVGARSL
jgi:hypothetical protein